MTLVLPVGLSFCSPRSLLAPVQEWPAALANPESAAALAQRCSQILYLSATGWACLCPSKSPVPCWVGSGRRIQGGALCSPCLGKPDFCLWAVWEGVCCCPGPCSHCCSCQTLSLGFSGFAPCYFNADWTFAKWVRAISVILSLKKKKKKAREDRRGEGKKDDFALQKLALYEQLCCFFIAVQTHLSTHVKFYHLCLGNPWK